MEVTLVFKFVYKRGLNTHLVHHSFTTYAGSHRDACVEPNTHNAQQQSVNSNLGNMYNVSPGGAVRQLSIARPWVYKGLDH